MKYTYKGKSYEINDKEIDKIMESMTDISISEACEMWLYDKELIVDEKAEELNEKASKNRITSTIHGAKGTKSDRKPRTKKENPLKKEIIQAIYLGIAENIKTDGEIIVTNDEKYLDFNVDGLEFTVNLVQHRKKK